jgi:nitroimidazol reductase NimA-like FMN-containing flavoprotein (pyridoxamine 5'-phosphate oxidase superfamily)
MTTPRTELDARFSGPNAQPTSWEETLAAIENAELFWISTVRRDGRPHVTPLVAVWLDDALHFSTGSGEQKALNLAADPYVALTTGVNDWRNGLDVVVEGKAVRVTDDEQLHRLAAAWTTRWDGRWRYEVGEGGFHRTKGTCSYTPSVRPRCSRSPRAPSATPAIASEASGLGPGPDRHPDREARHSGREHQNDQPGASREVSGSWREECGEGPTEHDSCARCDGGERLEHRSCPRAEGLIDKFVHGCLHRCPLRPIADTADHTVPTPEAAAPIEAIICRARCPNRAGLEPAARNA